MTETVTAYGDNVKGALRDIMIELMVYCRDGLDLNNAQVGAIFRRDRANVKRILDKHKPKLRTKR